MPKQNIQYLAISGQLQKKISNIWNTKKSISVIVYVNTNIQYRKLGEETGIIKHNNKVKGLQNRNRFHMQKGYRQVIIAPYLQGKKEKKSVGKTELSIFIG